NASVAFSQWPLRVSYALSRPSFDALAKHVRAGDPIYVPRRAGLFAIRKAEISYSGVICLWTTVNPGGNTGFVQCGPDHIPLNLWSSISLDNQWQFISED